jgi:hypothetical protein
MVTACNRFITQQQIIDTNYMQIRDYYITNDLDEHS